MEEVNISPFHSFFLCQNGVFSPFYLWVYPTCKRAILPTSSPHYVGCSHISYLDYQVLLYRREFPYFTPAVFLFFLFFFLFSFFFFLFLTRYLYFLRYCRCNLLLYYPGCKYCNNSFFWMSENFDVFRYF